MSVSSVNAVVEKSALDRGAPTVVSDNIIYYQILNEQKRFLELLNTISKDFSNKI